MFFDHKTKTFSGKIQKITPEEKAFLEEQIRAGVMVSSRHPTQEKIDEIIKWQEEHEFNEGAEEFL